MSTPSNKSQTMFAALITMLGSNAMMALGKIPNPATGKMAQQLEGAQLMIDILEMLRERTEGNLTEEESRLLERTLNDLRLNYVTEVSKRENPSSPKADAPAPPLDDDGIPGNLA